MLHVGGNYNQNQNHGAFYLNGNNAASNQNSNIVEPEQQHRLPSRLRLLFLANPLSGR